ncbi:MAG: hypothetical protein HOP06_06560 [Methylotenera sp.]|nr:hypothetical protein [Methylotenera sp.]
MTVSEIPSVDNERPNIAYVDEVEDERDNFYNDAYDSGLFSSIHILAPEPELDNLVNTLLELNIDALVTDFKLSDASPLNYNGEQLVSAFLAVRSDFPCFIRTSYDEDAFASSEDVNRVYSKITTDDANAGRYLFRRVVLQVNQYRRHISEWQEELVKLLELERTGPVIERILELDTKIEASLGKDQALPKHVKEKLLETENSLIRETERLISEMRRALGEE